MADKDKDKKNSIDERDKILLDFISSGEGDYDMAFGGKRYDLTNMTVKQVRELQKKLIKEGSPSSAMGRYQFMGYTLDGLIKSKKLKETDKFDIETQDKLALELANRRGYQKFKSGEISYEQFQNNLAKEWASIPTTDGTSYYSKDGLNKANKTVEQTQRMLMNLRGDDSFPPSVSPSIEGIPNNSGIEPEEYSLNNSTNNSTYSPEMLELLANSGTRNNNINLQEPQSENADLEEYNLNSRGNLNTFYGISEPIINPQDTEALASNMGNPDMNQARLGGLQLTNRFENGGPIDPRKKKKEDALSYFQGKTNYAPEQPEFKQYEDNSKSPAYQKAVREQERQKKTKNNPLVKLSEKVNKAVIDPTLETLELPQKGLTKLATDGKYDNPGDALGLEGGWNTAANIVLDPTNISGAALLRNSIRKKGLGTFKSDIDWGKWNKEIPNNKSLMKEYNTIEQQAKADGTWMKNPDGSEFKGTPEQFVQQNSENFKKAFPTPILDDLGNVQINYHGSPNKFNEFDPNKFYSGEFGKGIYTSPYKEKILKSYANPNRKGRVDKIREITGGTGNDAYLYELYFNGKNPKSFDDLYDVPYDIKNYGKNIEDFPTRAELYKKHDKFLKENPWIKTDEDFDRFLLNMKVVPREKINLTLPDNDFLKILDTPLKEQVAPFSNIPKSAVGNNGMFDMTNPNIYKSLFPGAIGAGLMMNNKENSTPQNSFALGGPIDPKKRRRLNYENELMSKVLTERNKDKNWVQRGLNPESYPTLTDENDNTVTHQLGYTTDNNGNAYVRPNVIQKSKGSELSWLDDNEANKYAKKTNTNMKIPDIELAEYYSQNGLIKHAMGGNLKKQQFKLGGGLLNEFNEGGKHEENPIGGIPQGIGSNGNLNTVEEGETKFGNYVFSDTLKLSKEDINSLFLPKKLEGKTYAEASKYLNDFIEDDPSNNITKKTIKRQLDSLMLGNEKAKSLYQDNNLDITNQNQMFLGGSEGVSVSENAMGFDISDPNAPSSPANLNNNTNLNTGAIGNSLSGVLSGINQVESVLNQDDPNNVSVGKNALSMAATGAGIGSVVPGIGTAIGAGVGAVTGVVTGLFGKRKAKRRARQKEIKDNQILQNSNLELFREGGPLTGLGYMGEVDDSFIPESVYNLNDPILRNMWGLNDINYNGPENKTRDKISPVQVKTVPGTYLTPTTEELKSRPPESNFKSKDGVGYNFSKGVHPLQYANVLGSYLNYSDARKLKPEVESLNRLNTRISPYLVDEQALINNARNTMNTSINAITNASGGSEGAVRAGILASGLNYNRGLSEATLQAQNYNNSQRLSADQMNLGTDQFNVGQDNLEKDINARERDAVRAIKAKARAALFDSISGVGKELTYDRRIRTLTGGYDNRGYDPENLTILKRLGII